MTPQLARTQTLDEIYDLLRAAAARKQPVAAIYDGLPRLLCPHVLGRNRKVVCVRSAISLGAAAAAACGWDQRGSVAGVVLRWANSARSSYGRTLGALSRELAGSTVSRKSISTPMLSLGTIRKKGSEAVAAVTGAPARCGASR